MDVFAARQAILNSSNEIVGYELLYRDSEDNAYPVGTDSHSATARILQSVLLNLGFRKFSSGKISWINFTEKCLLAEFPGLLPKDDVVIEILEDVTPSDEVYQRCKILCDKGYCLALDDFELKSDWLRFLDLVSFVKIDIRKTPLNEIGATIKVIKGAGHIKMLAEKIEDKETFEKARSMGFDFFQGYYLGSPEVQRLKDIPPSGQTLFHLPNELSSGGLEELASLFQSDAGLMFKLLVYKSLVLPHEQAAVSSVRQTIEFLGEFEYKRLVELLIVAHTPDAGALPSADCALERAWACGFVHEMVEPSKRDGDDFLLGFISGLPDFLNRPAECLLESIVVTDKVKALLINS